MTTPFHRGELDAQVRAGGGSAGSGIRDRMSPQHQAFFGQLPWVIAAGQIGDWPAATLLAGAPGFLSAEDERTLALTGALIEGDPAADALTPGAPIGLLGIELAARRRNRANGTVLARDASGLRIAVGQAFGNCPQYIHPRAPRFHSLKRFEPLAGLDAQARALISTADTFFVASLAPGIARGGLDVSHRGGEPGFLKLEGETLTIPDYAGNRYFNTLGNLVLNPRAALLFIDFTRGSILHLQGRTELNWEEQLWRVHVERARRAFPATSIL